MSKFSVKKPFTVLVAVVMLLVLGIVSFTKMTTDLLPSISLPYILVITTYPGASPEKVESDVTQVLESALGTVNGVENVTSVSNENYSMITLEFAEETNMDSAMVKLSSQIDQIELPDMAGTPSLLEISPDMMATMYAAVDYSGMDIYELTKFTEETVTPYLERQSGVASVTETGLVEKTVEIRLNERKIEKVNNQILGIAVDKLDDAQAELDDAKKKLKDAKAELKSNQEKLQTEQTDKTKELAEYSKMLDEAMATKAAYAAQLVGLQADETALKTERKAYVENKVVESYDQINADFQTAKETLTSDDVRELFSQEGYRRLIKNVMEEQWLIQPQDLKTKDKISELYERLNRQMEQIDKILKATGNEQSPLAKSTEQIRGNVEFMNEVNQIYNYVQIPLKMNGQNANGDLYVYTNKRKPREENGELSAFLHLDMDHLGSTDVFVKMKGKAVDTNFAFSDDASFDLVQKYLPILDAKLTALGYQSTITVSNEEKKVDFVEDFLKRDLPGGSNANVVHRYSFDVRA